jgi:hypothetical protein
MNLFKTNDLVILNRTVKDFDNHDEYTYNTVTFKKGIKSIYDMCELGEIFVVTKKPNWFSGAPSSIHIVYLRPISNTNEIRMAHPLELDEVV